MPIGRANTHQVPSLLKFSPEKTGVVETVEAANLNDILAANTLEQKSARPHNIKKVNPS